MVIPIVFSVDKNYAMPLQVTLISLMENKAPDTEYDIYVLHSDDYNADDRKRLSIAIRKYSERNLNFIAMGNAYDDVIISYSAITKATFYRLHIHKILPNDYEKCIYCDVDTIINCDLKSLFQVNLREYYLAGIIDPRVQYVGKRKEFESYNGYINAGVLVINLKKWREAAIENLFDKYTLYNLRYCDQDILNLACKGNILLLDEDTYVVLVSDNLNKRKDKKVRAAIIHYFGWLKPWDITIDSPYFKLWVDYAKKASVDVEKLRLEERRYKLENFLRKMGIQKVVVWGMMPLTLDICYFLEELGVQVLAIGDNDTEKVKQGNEYYKMIDGTRIFDIEETAYYIVNSSNYYEEIKKQLINNKVSANKIISWKELQNIMFDRRKESIATSLELKSNIRENLEDKSDL